MTRRPEVLGTTLRINLLGPHRLTATPISSPKRICAPSSFPEGPWATLLT
jgi:hypothetical protein